MERWRGRDAADADRPGGIVILLVLIMLVLIPLQILSGAVTPRESMPVPVQLIMSLAPTTHFVELAQSVLLRGAGLGIVWPKLLALIAIGAVFFYAALRRLRSTLQ